MFRLVFSIAFWLAGAVSGAAQSVVTGLQTGDSGRGWEAVGRLDIDGKGFCTGALIAPDLVLTAAHCLFERESGERIDPTRIEFLAGMRLGRAEAYRNVRRAVVHPDFRLTETITMKAVPNDLALLQLDQPIRLPQWQPFAISSDARGEVGVVSYVHDRAELPSLQEVCEILGEQDGVLVMNCAVDFGASGAPVFRIENGEARIVSVISAKAFMDDQPVALGVMLEAPLRLLRAEMQALQYTNRDTSAKFIRP